MTARIGIIGPGRLGRQLAYWLARGNRAPTAIMGRSVDSLASASELIQAAGAPAPDLCPDVDSIAEVSDVILITVPDRQIPTIAAKLANAPIHGRCIAHSCGALPASLLDPVTAGGASPACFHPIQSFSSLDQSMVLDPPESGPFFGIAIGVEAEDSHVDELTSIVRALHAVPLRITGDPTARALYHAAAVVASNAMVGLLDFSIELMTGAGIEPEAARIALLPLMGGTLTNLVHHSPADALTGPVARGDAETIETHLEALAGSPTLQALYSNLTARLLLLAVRGGRIDGDQADQISQVLLKRLLRKG